MQIQCFASIPVEKDEPAAAIRQFVAFLRSKAEDTGKAEIAINLIGVSSRARGTISGLRPEQSKGMKFDKALEFAEGLCSLGAAKSKSLSFILSATGFQWKGAAGGTEGRLVLADAKSFRKKERFSLSAQLAFEAADPHAPFIASTLDEVYRQTGVRFQLRDSLMRMAAG